MINKRRNISIIVFCLYIAAVAVLCFSKPDDLPQMPLLWFGLPSDKVAHFIMFAPFPILLHMVFTKENYEKRKEFANLAIIMVAGCGMAMGTELIQAQLEYRSAETNDFYADAAGVALGTVCTAFYLLIKK